MAASPDSGQRKPETQGPPLLLPTLPDHGPCFWLAAQPRKGYGLVASSRCHFIPVALESRNQMADEAAFSRHTLLMLGSCAPDQRGPQAHKLESGLGALVLLLA